MLEAKHWNVVGQSGCPFHWWQIQGSPHSNDVTGSTRSSKSGLKGYPEEYRVGSHTRLSFTSSTISIYQYRLAIWALVKMCQNRTTMWHLHVYSTLGVPASQLANTAIPAYATSSTSVLIYSAAKPRNVGDCWGLDTSTTQSVQRIKHGLVHADERGKFNRFSPFLPVCLHATALPKPNRLGVLAVQPHAAQGSDSFARQHCNTNTTVASTTSFKSWKRCKTVME